MSPYRVLTLDLETRHLASEVGGWPRLLAGAGGISALVIHDSLTGRHRCFNDTTLEKAAGFIERAISMENVPLPTILCTFNGKGFDLPLLQALLGRPLQVPPRQHVDLYQLVKEALREGDPWKANSLHEIARRTLGEGKVGNSEQAPTLAREGRWLTLFRYCKKDVDLTRRLFQFAREHGGVISHSGDLLPLPIPDWLRLKVAEAT